MADLAITEITDDGIDPDGVDVAATAGGDEYVNDEHTVLYVNNASAGSVTVTITAQKTEVRKPGYGTLAIANIAVAVPAGGRRLVKAPPAAYNDADGRAQVTYSAATSVTVAALRAPRS